MKKHRGILKAKSQIIKKKADKTRTIHSKDLGDPNRNLEKDFVLKGHFFPQDDIFFSWLTLYRGKQSISFK